MNFFDEIIDSAKTALDKTSEKAEEIIDKGKTQVRIVRLRGELRRCYTRLGLRVYNKSKAGEDFGSDVEMRIREIDILREQLADLKEQSELIKYSKKCKNCGSYNDKEDEFCLDCGAALNPYHKTVYSVRFPDEEEKK